MLKTLSKPYYSSLSIILQDEIRAGKYENDYLPTEMELCDEFSVSRITVRKALKLLEEKKILETAQGKRRKIKNRKVSEKQKKDGNAQELICLTPYAMPCYNILSNKINLMAIEKNFTPISLVMEKRSKLESFIGFPALRRASGLICLGIPTLDLLNNINDLDIPTVYAGFHGPHSEDSVITDNYSGGYIGAEHLIKNGHKNILFINPLHPLDAAFLERESGFLQAVKDYGVNFKIYRDLGKNCVIGDEKLLLELLSSDPKPSGMFVSTDLNIPSIFSFLRKNKIDPLKDLSVIGFDNMINVLDWAREEVDSIEQPWEKIAEYSFKRLIEKIENPKSEGLTVSFKPKLITKGTVRRIP